MTFRKAGTQFLKLNVSVELKKLFELPVSDIGGHIKMMSSVRYIH